MDSSYILLTLLLLYTFYIYYDRNDGPTGRRYYRNKIRNKHYDNLRNWSCFKYLASYFPIRLHKTCDISSDNTKDGKQQMKQSYIFLYQPHGVIGMGVSTAINTNGCNFDTIYPNLSLRCAVTLDVPFYIPFLREFIITLGFVHANKVSLEHILRDRKESIVLVPGGAMEALYTKSHSFRCISRTASIRLALRTNSAIVPCFGFGENDAFVVHSFSPSSYCFRVQRWLCQHLSFSTPILLSPFAQRQPINVVIGAPIYFTDVNLHNETCLSDEIVMKCHNQYVKSIEKLYSEHKARFGYDDVPLEWFHK
jgi:hypothetical protein